MLSSEQYEKDASALRKAMKGFGTDEAPIINLTANRNNADRQQILKFYKSSFGRDLIKDLEDELSGNLRKGIIAMYRTPIDYDCYELYHAMKGVGTNEETLIEIIGTRNNETLKKIKLRFKELFQKELEEELKDETSGEFKKLLVALVQCNRSELTTLDENKLDKDVKDLYEAGEGKWGTDSSVFNRVFALRSPEELRYINKNYCKQMGKDLFKVIESEFSGDAQKLYKAVLHSVINATDYFAERIRWACKGWGTNDDVLIRVLVCRDEIDLKQIKEMYPKKFGKTLYQEIKDETSGDYKNLLLAIAMTD